MESDQRRLRAGRVRLGARVLRAARLPRRAASDARLVAWADLGGDHMCTISSARPWRRGCRRLHARFGLARFTQAWRARAGSRPDRLVGGRRAVAALSCRRDQRRWLERDECRRHQRHHRAVVRARAASGARYGLQRRQRRRHRVLAAVGGGDRFPRFSRGCHNDRAGGGTDRLADRGDAVCAHAAADGARAGWRRARCRAGQRHVAECAAAAWRAALARPDVPYAGRRHGIRAVRPTRPGHALVLAAAADVRRPARGLRHGARDGDGDRRAHIAWMGHADRC